MVNINRKRHTDVEKSHMVRYVNDERSLNIFGILLENKNIIDFSYLSAKHFNNILEASSLQSSISAVA